MKWENSNRAALWKDEMKKETKKMNFYIDEIFHTIKNEDIVKLCIKVTEQQRRIDAIVRCMEQDKANGIFE